jgi:selenocysteine lyase/cysteine desulfurase
VDLYAASVFKWLLSGFGLAFVSMKRDFAATLEPTLRGHGNEGDSRELRYGHANHPGLYALAATLEYLQGIGWQAIHERVDSLAQHLDAELGRAECSVITPAGARAGIVSIELADATLCAERLNARGVRVESRAGLIRISPHFYNTGAEVERFVDILSLDRAGR